MALVRASDAAKMSQAERKDKLKDLKMELIRANVLAHKQTAKTKEIKRAISRLTTYSHASKNAREKIITSPKNGKVKTK